MKNLIVVLAVLAMASIFSVPAMAQEEGGERMFSFGFETGAYSKYVDELSGYRILDEPVVTAFAEINHGSGAYLAVEGYKSLNGEDYDEVNLYVGFSSEAWGSLWEVGYAYYQEYELHGIYASTQLTRFEFWGFTPFVDVEVDIPDNDEAGDGGFLYRVGLLTSVPVFEQEIDLSFSVAGHDGAWGTRSELVSSAKIAASTTITLVEEVAEIVPEVSYQKRLGYAPAGEEDESAGGMTNNEFWMGAKVVFYF